MLFNLIIVVWLATLTEMQPSVNCENGLAKGPNRNSTELSAKCERN